MALSVIGNDPWFQIGCMSGALAVVMGAFGAHGLRNRVTDPRLLKAWETAAHYHLVHSVALCMAPFSARRQLGGLLLLGGVALFSGSLYAMVLSSVRGLGAITPIGGTLLIAGWVALSGLV